MKITLEWLREKNACGEGTQWFLSQTESEHQAVIKALIKEGQYNWANWTLTNLMTHKQNVQYSCYAAKQSLYTFEKLYPTDKRPRKAISAAIKWANNPTDANRSAAESAARSAWSAAESAWSAARSAAWSAEESAWLARSTAESAARSAAGSAWSAAWKKVLKYGLRLTEGV